MKIQNFKVNDWCFCDYTLSKVLKVKDGVPHELTTGYIRKSGDFDGRCYHLSIETLHASDSARIWADKFHSVNMNLNYPRIIDRLERLWAEICMSEGEKATEKAYDEMNKFGKNIMSAVSDCSRCDVDGISLFRN